MIAGQIEIQLMANIARLQRDMDRANQLVSRATASMERAASAAKAALASIGSGISIQQLAQLTDQYTKFTAQLQLATTSQREYAQAYADVKRIATTAQADLGATGVLYARIANGTRELGVAQAQVANITETVNLALKVSGATAEESHSAMLQLSQAFASGTLRGAEFNAVNEAAPRLMKALADGMGVPVGALKKMAEEGQITSGIMADVLPQALSDLQDEAKHVQTIAGAFTLLKNNVMEFVGTQAQASGAVSAITGGLSLLASNLMLVAGAVITIGTAKLGSILGGWVAETYRQVAAAGALRAANIAAAESEVAATNAKLAQMGVTQSMLIVAREEAVAKLASSNANITTARTAMAAAEAAGAQSFALRTLRLATAELAVAEAQRTAMLAELAILGRQQASVSAQITAATAAQAAAQTGLNAATGAGIGAASLASRALGFLGGPIGALITVLGLAATAWAVWGDKSKDATEKAAESFDEAQVRIIKGLDEQIEKNEKLLSLKNAGLNKGEAEKALPYVDQLAAASTRLNAINSRSGEFTGQSNTELDFARIKVMRDIADLTDKMAKAEKSGAAVAAASVAERVAAFKKEHATKQEQMAAELKAIQDLKGKTSEYAEMERRIREKYADKGALAGIKKDANLLAELSGVTATYMEDLSRLQAIRAAGNVGEARYVELVTELIGKQPGVQKAEQERAKALKQVADFEKAYGEALGMTAGILAERVKDAEAEASQNEDLARTYGMTKSAIEQLELARLEDQLAQRSSLGLTLDEIETLEKLIAAKKRNAAALGAMEQVDAAKKAQEEWKRAAESIEQSLTDALLRGFESGKGFGENLVDTLKNMFKTLVLRPVISAITNPISQGIASMVGGPVATTAAAASGGGAGNAMGLASGAAGLAGLFGAGGLTGSLMAGAGWLTGATTLGGSLAAAGSLAATGTLGGIASGLGMVAGALGPIALGIGAAVAIWKKLDTSGTYHTGGAASATGDQVSTIRAEMLRFEATRTNEKTEQFVSQLAGGVVSILDSTALAFGKTAGYTAATAFADDTSKDGAWGALVISKMGEKLIDWQDSRTSKWAPKEFADGEAGQKQYLEALSKSVRVALDGIGLPGWAKTMLDGVGEGASIEELAKLVDSINATQAALKAMGAQLVGFSSLSDAAVSALMKAAGGIEALASSASVYYDNFYSETEKTAAVQKQMAEAFQAVGLAVPSTRDGFRALVEQQLALGESGATAAAVLFKHAGVFAQLHPLVEAVTVVVEDQAEALRKELQARKDLGASLLGGVDSAFSALRRVVDREKSLLQDRIAKEQELIAKHQALSSSLRGALDSMGGLDGGLESRISAQAQIQSALAIAKAGGMLPSADSLKSALSVLSKDASGVFASQADYLRDFYLTRTGIEDLADLTDDTLSLEERSLKQLESQVTALDKIVANGQAQIDALNGLDVSQLTLAHAIAAMASSVGAAQANPVASSSGSIAKLYQEILKRAPDASGLEFWKDRLAEGVSLAEIREAMKQSDEYKKLKGIPGYAAGGAHAGGWRVVGETGWEVEHTGPSRVVSHSESRQMLDNRQVVDAIHELQAAVFPVLYQTAKNAGRAANSLENMDRVGVEIREESNA
ncbi:tape measure protein [Massilia sp. DD77]|uniref:tape measure protein n=1 Tax=Massilia sp. DD77 TaxID=3109349 RepID=UPI002FFF0B34